MLAWWWSGGWSAGWFGGLSVSWSIAALAGGGLVVGLLVGLAVCLSVGLLLLLLLLLPRRLAKGRREAQRAGDICLVCCCSDVGLVFVRWLVFCVVKLCLCVLLLLLLLLLPRWLAEGRREARQQTLVFCVVKLCFVHAAAAAAAVPGEVAPRGPSTSFGLLCC